jgi:hypothetical protein
VDRLLLEAVLVVVVVLVPDRGLLPLLLTARGVVSQRGGRRRCGGGDVDARRGCCSGEDALVDVVLLPLQPLGPLAELRLPRDEGLSVRCELGVHALKLLHARGDALVLLVDSALRDARRLVGLRLGLPQLPLQLANLPP